MPFFSLYLNICGLRKGPGKFLMGVLESPGKVLDFFVSKRVGTLKSVPMSDITVYCISSAVSHKLGTLWLFHDCSFPSAKGLWFCYQLTYQLCYLCYYYSLG